MYKEYTQLPGECPKQVNFQTKILKLFDCDYVIEVIIDYIQLILLNIGKSFNKDLTSKNKNP